MVNTILVRHLYPQRLNPKIETVRHQQSDSRNRAIDKAEPATAKILIFRTLKKGPLETVEQGSLDPKPNQSPKPLKSDPLQKNIISPKLL